MPEAIYKLEPHRTIHLRGFDGFGSAAAMYGASASGFTVSGVFRDAADFCVLIIWDADNYFEHPRMKYLPDFDFSGMVLQFDVAYRNLQPLDSQKFPSIDWPYLDVIRPDNSTAQISLFNNAAQVAGTYTAAAGTFTVETSSVLAGNRLTIWYLNNAFDYIATGGESASAIAAALAAECNAVDWSTQAPTAALWAHAAGADLTFEYARYGKVATNGHAVTFVSGENFAGLKVGDAMRVGAVETTVLAFDGPLAVQTSADLGFASSVAYLAPRGGYDGNMVRMYATAPAPAHLASAEAVVQLSGGSSAATWQVTLDFTALGIDQVRQMVLTFAPALADSAAYVAAEWDAVFTNWGVIADPSGNSQLHVAAAPNSVRVEETDVACIYSGQSWGSEAGFYSQGFARQASTVGDSVTLYYDCQQTHDLHLGTSLYSDLGQWGVSVDGDAETLLDCYLPVEPPVVTRRRLRVAVRPGHHIVVLTVRAANPLSTGTAVYFDFVEAAVLGDVPDAPGPFPLRSPALDYDTDHTYRNSPERVLWMFDTLGFTGPMNEYVGVFWWNQRTLTGEMLPSATVTFGGTFVAGDQAFVIVGGLAVGKTVFPSETNATIAAHIAYTINETLGGLWASAVGAVLTITSRSAVGGEYNFTLTTSVESALGTATAMGSLAGGVPGNWDIDPSQSPPLNYALRQWHADFFALVKARSRTVVSSFSMELVNPPDDPGAGHVWAARFPDGPPVETATGFGVLNSTQCPPMAPEFLAYQIAVYLDIAGLQAAAGLTPELQFGEFLWWYFTDWSAGNPAGGMAYYDAATTAAALVSLGRALHLFIRTTDDPGVNGGADSGFLALRLAAHVSMIVDAVLAVYPTALFEVLWPYDVNYPVPIGRESLGGRLNYAVNLPASWKTKIGSGLDRFKTEALDFGSGNTRSLDLAQQAILFSTVVLGWPLDSVRYLFPVDNGGCPWEAEYLMAVDARMPATTPFAIDHVCLLAWRVEEPVARGGASWF